MCNWYWLQCNLGFACRTSGTTGTRKPTAKQKEITENCTPAFRQFDALPLFAYRLDAVIVWIIWTRRPQQQCKHSNRFLRRDLQLFRSDHVPSVVATLNECISQPIIEHSKSPNKIRKKQSLNERGSRAHITATIISERGQKHRHIKIDEFTTYQCDLKCKIKDWRDSRLFLRCPSRNTQTTHTQSAAAHRQKSNEPFRVTWVARQQFVFFGSAAACSSACSRTRHECKSANKMNEKKTMSEWFVRFLSPPTAIRLPPTLSLFLSLSIRQLGSYKCHAAIFGVFVQ